LLIEAVFFFVSVAIIVAMAVVIHKFKISSSADRRMRGFNLLTIVALAWIAVAIIDLLASRDHFAFVYTTKVAFSVIVSYCSFWFFLNFTESKLTRIKAVQYALIILPAIDILLLVTTSWHGLYFASFSNPESSANPALPKGIFFWIHIGLLVASALFVYAILFAYIVKNMRKYPFLAVAGAGAVLPLALNVAFTFGFEYDLSPIGFFFTVTLFAYVSSIAKLQNNPAIFKETLARISMAPDMYADDFALAKKMLTEESGNALRVSMSAIWRFSECENLLVNSASFNRLTGSAETIESLDLTLHSELRDSIRKTRCLAVSDISVSKSALSQVLLSIYPELCAFVLVPTSRSLKFSGMVFFGQFRSETYPTKRVWMPDEENFAVSVADLLIIAVENFERQKLMKSLESRTLELEEACIAIEKLSLIDVLTEIPNRRSFNGHMAEEWEKAIKNNSQLGLLILDIDEFKKYNDTFGHQQGDTALQAVAKALLQTVAEANGFSARWGGEEFIALLPNANAKSTLKLAEEIRKNICALTIPTISGSPTKLTVSIGVAVKSPKDNVSVDGLISSADNALYKAKESGRNKVESH